MTQKSIKLLILTFIGLAIFVSLLGSTGQLGSDPYTIMILAVSIGVTLFLVLLVVPVLSRLLLQPEAINILLGILHNEKAKINIDVDRVRSAFPRDPVVQSICYSVNTRTLTSDMLKNAEDHLRMLSRRAKRRSTVLWVLAFTIPTAAALFHILRTVIGVLF